METKNKQSKKRGSGIILTILIVVCALVLGFALYKVISIQSNYKKAQNQYSALREYTKMAEDTEEEDSASVTADSFSEESSESAIDREEAKRGQNTKKTKKAPITVDHASLQALNPDYIGWLYIEALNISYPIMRGPDDDFYLHRTFEKDYLFAGSLFINSVSSRDFSDPHTIIYGHNMKDNSMFGTLRLLYDDALCQQYPYFWVLTPQGDYCYRIFSLYTCDAEANTYTLFSGSGDNVASYIQSMRNLSFIDTGDFTCDADSKIVTLSTCVQESGRERFVVQGILVK